MAQERQRIQVEKQRAQRLARMREDMGGGGAADQGYQGGSRQHQHHRGGSGRSPRQGGKAGDGDGAGPGVSGASNKPILSEGEMDAKWAQFESQMQIARASQQTIRYTNYGTQLT